jgi:hypothetical protein
MILEVCTNLTMVKIFDQSALWAQLAMLEKIFHVTLYMDFFIYRQNCCQFFLLIFLHEAGTWDPNYTSGVDFFDHVFYNLKNSSQDLSNEESNFILSSQIVIELLKHSHFLTNYLKVQILASCNNLRIKGKILNLQSFDLGH